jgi:TorA maturation chaperone TorD
MSQTLAELHLLLSRAFLPPMGANFVAAFRRDLADDLEALARELPFECIDPIRNLRASLDAVTDGGHLLQAYSALFLQPPQRVFLNASVHLDGALLGASSLAMEEAYRRHGLHPAESLRDLSDHLSRLFEFVALLFVRAAEAGTAEQSSALSAEAREFSAAFLRPWLPGFAVEVRGACDELGLPKPYQHLAELAAIAVWEGDAWRRPDAAAQDRPERAPRQADCSACGQPFAEDAALAAVRRIMEKRGLGIAHLDRCPNCRGLTDNGSTDTLPARQLGVEDVR